MAGIPARRRNEIGAWHDQCERVYWSSGALVREIDEGELNERERFRGQIS